MQSQSLVGLKAIDIARLLVRDKAFAITSYNKPLAVVIPAEYKNKREFRATMEKVAEELFDHE